MDRLLRAISRVRERIRPEAPAHPPLDELTPTFVKADERLKQIYFDVIVSINNDLTAFISKEI